MATLESVEHVIKGSMRLGGQEHLYMETMSCIAIPRREHGEMEIIASSQYLSGIQNTVSTALGVPANRIVVKLKRVGKCEHRHVSDIMVYALGGAFGGKELKTVAPYTAVAVAANKLIVSFLTKLIDLSGIRVQTPVRMKMDRNEDIANTGARAAALGKYKVSELTKRWNFPQIGWIHK